MSNTNTNAVYDVEELDVVSELPETDAEQVFSEEPQPAKKSTVWNRIFAAIFVAMCAAVVFLKIAVVSGAAVVEMSLLDTVKDLFSDGASKVFGAIPAIADTANIAGQFAAISLFMFLLSLVLTVIFGLITVISGKLLRVSAFFCSAGFFWYSLSIVAVSAGDVLNYICLGCAAVSILVYLVLGFKKAGKKALTALIQLVLTLAVFVALAYGITKNLAAFEAGLSSFGITAVSKAFFAIIFAFVLILALGYLRLQTKKGLALDMIRYIVEFLVGGVICYVAIASKATEKLFLICAIVATVVALLQIVICIIQIRCGKPKKEKVVEEVVEEEPVVEEFVREEYAEALPYEGGPVAGVEVAEEVNPTYVAPLPEVQTAGYDFYNSKSFDPFIAALNAEERNQFTELFILKYQGVMPEIPDYVVGGDNKEFFRKLFIYLGQYRDRIPDGLLAKIYQFAIKM